MLQGSTSHKIDWDKPSSRALLLLPYIAYSCMTKNVMTSCDIKWLLDPIDLFQILAHWLIVDVQAQRPSPVPLDEITARVACSARYHAGHGEVRCAKDPPRGHEVCKDMQSDCSQRWKLARQICTLNMAKSRRLDD